MVLLIHGRVTTLLVKEISEGSRIMEMAYSTDEVEDFQTEISYDLFCYLSAGLLVEQFDLAGILWMQNFANNPGRGARGISAQLDRSRYHRKGSTKMLLPSWPGLTG